jgi:predicted neutral ceramidase superfamily lipid hydrolase
MSSSYSDFFRDMNPFFYRHIPRASALFAALLAISVLTGIAAVVLLNLSAINTRFSYSIVNGTTTGILIITLPTLLTVIIMKALKRYVALKYMFFLSLLGAVSYSLFILLGSATYMLTHAYAVSGVVILVGDASIYGWWLLAAKVVLGQKKRAALFALVQPTLNILLYIPYSKFIFSFSTPLGILLIKLYAGIGVFFVLSYTLMFVFNKPIEKGLGGFRVFDAFSQMVQNWLFDINTSSPFGTKFGVPEDIDTDTVVMKDKEGRIKAVFFAPDIHYGPSGTLAGSNFPYMLERYSTLRYRAPTFVMHRPVDLDLNPISVNQFGQLKGALDGGIKESVKSTAMGDIMTYSKATYKTSTVIRLGLGRVQLATMTRAPRVTEDVSPDVAYTFKGMLEHGAERAIIIDAHNSRYENAPKAELAGIKPNSDLADEYVNAIKQSGRPQHKSACIKVGVNRTELFNRLGRPYDLADGNLNVAVFSFNGFKYAILHFNSNNILPNLRNEIVGHVKDRYKIEAEVYTTDTHAVNSMGFTERNVLGRHVNQKKLISAIDEAVGKALLDVSPVSVYHKRGTMKGFMVWGPNMRDKMTAVATSVYEMARLLVPIVVAIGFVAAAWVILIV